MKGVIDLAFSKPATYHRDSHEDERDGDSVSIENQQLILRKFVAEHGGTIVEEYVDDGWSGTNFDRPGVKKMLADAQAGKIDTIIVKDLSRFGRNYIQVGQYIDYIFPAYGIRFIAINDNIDTSDRQSTAMDMMPIMNVFNEWHAANTSKKIRAVLSASWNSGKYTNWNYCYGYKVGTDEKRTAVIDEEAANVVRRIFNLRLQGKSCRTIAILLTDEKVPNPTSYFTRADGKKSDRTCLSYWNGGTIKWILTNPTYIGNMVQHKTTRVSYKNHKAIKVPKSEQIVKENAHEAIISFETWQKVQEINKKSLRGKADKNNVVHPLSGLLVCPDCGKKLKLKIKHGSEYRYYYCGTYLNLGKKYCSTHAVIEKNITKLVLDDIRALTGFVKIDEIKAREQFLKQLSKNDAENKYSDECQLKALQGRLTELDKLIQTTYEDRVLGRMPDDLCKTLCEKYRKEKRTIEAKVMEIDKRQNEIATNEASVDEFIKRLKFYANCQTLTREMCLQLINFISVGVKDENGKREINIYYKFITDKNIKEFQKKPYK